MFIRYSRAPQISMPRPHEELRYVGVVRVIVTRLKRSHLCRNHASDSFETSSCTGGRRTSASFTCLFHCLSPVTLELLIAILKSHHGVYQSPIDAFAGALFRPTALPRSRSGMTQIDNARTNTNPPPQAQLPHQAMLPRASMRCLSSSCVLGRGLVGTEQPD